MPRKQRLRFSKGMVISSPKDLIDVIEDLVPAERLAVDCETQAFSDETFHPWELELHGIGVYTPDAYGFILPEALDGKSRSALNELLATRRLTFHNAKFDLQVLKANGFDVDRYL